MKATNGGRHGSDHGVQEAGGGVSGGGGGVAVAEARRVAPERGRELGRGVREADATADAGAAGQGVPAGGGVGVGGDGVRPVDAGGADERLRGKEEGGRRKDEGGRRKEEDTRACAPAREGDGLPEVTAEEVARGYVSAVCGVLHVVRFGCMMLVKEACLEFETGVKPGDPAYGSGLKGWLRTNVPDVNYKTAMGFKGTAAKVCEILDFPADVMLRALNPDPKALPEEEDGERLVEARERLLEIVHGKSSLHAFRLWITGGAPQLPDADGPGAEDTEKAEEAALDSARRFARSVADALKCLDPRKKNTVAKDVAKTLRDTLGLKGLAWLAKVLEEAEG